MMKPRSAVPAQEAPAQLTDAASGMFRHLGEASRQLMDLQAQAAAIVWVEAVIGLQAVVSAVWMQALALTVFPARHAGLPPVKERRRSDSVVIQFPDRRRGGGE